jgi:hypothetical protein
MFSTLGAVASLAVVAVAAPLAADDSVPAAGESVVFTPLARHALPHESYVRVVALDLASPSRVPTRVPTRMTRLLVVGGWNKRQL